RPAWRRAQDLDVRRQQAGLLAQLAEHRLDRRLVAVHPALRELPAVAAYPPCPEHASVAVHQHDAHVGAIAVRIDHDADLEGFDVPWDITVPTVPRAPCADKRAAPEIDDDGRPMDNCRFPAPCAAAPPWLCSSAG